MTTTIHEKSPTSRELDIRVDESELQAAFDEAYRTMRPKLAMPGFRPGKAPMSMLKKMHGDAIEGEALEKLAQEKFREAIEENKIEPIGQPVMTDLHRHAGEGAHFKVVYEVPPVIELQDFSGVEVEKRIIPVRDEDVERTIERMRFRRATREPITIIENDQTAAKLSFRETNAPEGREPGKSEEEVFLGDPDIIPELKSALMGKSVGDVVEIALPTRRTRANGESDEEKPEAAEITIVEAEKVTMPELDEAFIKELSQDKATTPDEFRTIVREELDQARAKASNEDLEERIVAKLLEMHPFEVPHSIGHAIIDQMIEETQQENTRRGFPANYGIDENEFHDRNWPIAEARGRWMLLREKLIEDANLEATDEDYEKLAEEEGAKYGLPKENLLKYYRKYDTIKNRIVNEKLGTMLREKVKVVENVIEPG